MSAKRQGGGGSERGAGPGETVIGVVERVSAWSARVGVVSGLGRMRAGRAARGMVVVGVERASNPLGAGAGRARAAVVIGVVVGVEGAGGGPRRVTHASPGRGGPVVARVHLLLCVGRLGGLADGQQLLLRNQLQLLAQRLLLGGRDGEGVAARRERRRRLLDDSVRAEGVGEPPHARCSPGGGVGWGGKDDAAGHHHGQRVWAGARREGGQKSTNASESVTSRSGEARCRTWTYIQATAIDIWPRARACRRNRIETAWSTAARIAAGSQSQPERACRC